MGDRATYALGDFFPFSREVWLRLFVRLNEGWWPLQLLCVLAGIGLLAALWKRRGARPVGVLLGAAWVLCGWAFHLDLYASLNWAGRYSGWAFAAQGFLLAGYAASGRLALVEEHDPASRLGLGLAAVSLLALPWLDPLATDQSWRGAACFALAPGPTVAVTVGVLLSVRSAPWFLFVVPVLWGVAAALTSLQMQTPSGWATLAVVATAAVAAGWQRLR